MRIALLTATAMAFAVAAHAEGFNLQALQQQLSATPAAAQASQGMQQMVMQQALQQAAANPQMVTQLANSLSPQQQLSLTQQAMAIGQKLFTPAEQAKLTAFTATPEGASIVSKMPQLAQQLAPVVLQMYAQQAGKIAPAAGTTK